MTALTVVEAGLGSGALSIALLRAIGPTGKLYTYEKIPDAIVRAKKNIALAMGDTSNHTIHEEADIYEGIRERSVDRVVLDVPEPWQVLPHAKEVVRPGGGIAIFVPTALQMHETVQELYRVGGFIEFKAMEILERRWKVSARSVRPENQMIAHTGFLMFARRTARSTLGMSDLVVTRIPITAVSYPAMTAISMSVTADQPSATCPLPSL